MALPEVSIAIKDGALGVLPPNGNNVLTLLGMCSSGTANTAYEFGDPQVIKDTLGTGPLVEAAAAVLREAGGSVRCVKISGSTAATFGSVTLSGTGSSVLTLTGSTPYDTYNAKIKIVTGGANPASAVVTFQYSLDAGLNYSSVIALPAAGTYTIPGTGIALTFSAASLVAADIYSFDTVAPGYTTGEMNTAYDAAVLDQEAAFFGIGLIGTPADATAAQAVFSALDTKLEASATAFRYVRGFMQAHSASDSATKSAFAALTSKRLVVCQGTVRLASAVGAYQVDRPVLYSVLARAAKATPSQDLAEVAAGSLLGVTAVSRNESSTPNLDAYNFTTVRSLVGLRGFYITNCNLFSDNTSDYQYLQHGRVMDIACLLTRVGMLKFLNGSVRVNTSTGRILEEDAAAIESYVEGVVRAGVIQPGYASDARVTVIRTDNILSTSTLRATIRVTPLGYLKAIETTIGYFNPALAPQQAA